MNLSKLSIITEKKHMFSATTAGTVTIEKSCHEKWDFTIDKNTAKKYIPNGTFISLRAKCHLTDGKATVMAEKEGIE